MSEHHLPARPPAAPDQQPSGPSFESPVLQERAAPLKDPSASARMAAYSGQRSAALDEARYRVSGGQQGTAPAARLSQERASAAASVSRFFRKASGSPSGLAGAPTGSGSALPATTKSQMENKLGADLSSVRVHTGGESAQAASQLGARAFTDGSDIHFGAGQFAPGTKEGDRLIAHELTHTVQSQRSGLQRKAEESDGAQGAEGASQAGGEQQVSQPHEPAEQEADAVGDKVADALHGGPGAAGGDQAQAGEGPAGDKAQGGDKSQGDKAQGDKAQAAGGDKAEGGAVAAGVEAPVAPISAKLEGVGPKLWRAAPGPTPPAPGPNPPAPNPAAAAFHAQVDSEAAALQTATTVDAFSAAVQATSVLVKPASKSKVATRVSRLMNSYSRALPVWSAMPPVDGQAAVDKFWTTRMGMVTTHLPAAIASAATAAATALKTKDAPDPEKQMAADKVFNAVIGASGYQINAPETQASDQTVNDQGGAAKCFDVGDLFWKMDKTLRNQWCAAVGKAEEAAQADYIAAAVAKGKPPLAPLGKEGVAPWNAMTVDRLYTAGLTGFVGMGKDAPTVASYDDAIKKFALNKSYYPSGKMFIVHADAASVNAQKAAGTLKIGKPSIFCHLEFEEFLYAESDRERGELAKMNADGSAQEQHNGVKEMSCVGLASEIWASARLV